MNKKMNFIFGLVMLIGSMCFAESAILFNREQFQAHRANAFTPPYALTVPFVYTGVATFDGMFIDTDSDVCVEKEKGRFNIFMTICQPCIDCYPCSFVSAESSDEPLEMTAYGANAVEPNKITKWNMYLTQEDKKNKTVYITKIDLTEDEETTFFTGNNKDNAVVQGILSPSLFISGKKTNYKFKYTDAVLVDDGEWELTGTGKETAYIKSISSMTGRYNFANLDTADGDGANFQCTIKLSRNSSMTKNAIKGVFETDINKKLGNWEDCHYETNAGYCESYYSSTWDVDTDAMDEYLNNKYEKKKWSVEVLDEVTLNEAFVAFFE